MLNVFHLLLQYIEMKAFIVPNKSHTQLALSVNEC